MPDKQIYEIDGAAFSTLDEFFDEFTRKIIPDAKWGHNLNAFNDILRGGFGTPIAGFVLRWKNSDLSRKRLNYQEAIRQLECQLENCHPTACEYLAAELERAKNETGGTVFDWLVDIIQVHCPGGAESEDGVELELK
jgi:RNAse (barnase) inhibitor barstar